MTGRGSSLRKGLVALAIFLFFGAVFAVKSQYKKDGSAEAQPVSSASSAGAHAYLFLNGQDQDESCSGIYRLFDESVKSLPKGIESSRHDTSGDQALFKKYDIHVVPTVVLVDPKGDVTAKVEGEGPEVQGRIRQAFASFAALSQ